MSIVAMLVCGGCTTSTIRTDESRSNTAATTAPSTVTESVDGGLGVPSLGLTFQLPDSFVVIDEPDLLFFARSVDPLALFSIDPDGPTVTDHEAEGDETLSDIEFGDVRGVVITNAVLDGLPPGVSANELLVSNRDRSFTVIMSAASAAALEDAWQVFIDSVAITAAG
jgi:hypothetical protein